MMRIEICLLCFFFLIAGCDSGDDLGITQPTPLDLEAPTYFGDFKIPEDNPTTIEGVELGRMLFYERKMSAQNALSCGTCHQQALAFTDGRALGIGFPLIDLPFSTMSLANILYNNRQFWNGRTETLEEQALEPIQNPLEMNQSLQETVQKLVADGKYQEKFRAAFGSEEISTERIAKAIAQFERTLISSDSKYDKSVRGETQLSDQELRGQQLFFTHPDPAANLRGGNCGDCHSTFLTSGFNVDFDGFHNNGLDTEAELREGLQEVTGNDFDKGKFKAPTLRNIELTAPYMHDGRFTTLEEVLDHYNEHIVISTTLDPLILEASNESVTPGNPILLHLTDQEKEDIIAFLKTLTDFTFINDEKFSDPFN